MRIGAEHLLKQYGSPLAVAEAFLLGKVSAEMQQFVGDLVDDTILKAADMRLRRRQDNTPKVTELAIANPEYAVCFDCTTLTREPVTKCEKCGSENLQHRKQS